LQIEGNRDKEKFYPIAGKGGREEGGHLERKGY
jgi:hypothetical protein